MSTRMAKRAGFCDGLSRRTFLKVGGLAMGGLSLPEILRAEALSGTGRSHKAVIMVFLSGGPPHQDLVDLKPHAPVEYRGEFEPISSAVPGIQVCELLPMLAARMDRLAIIRSLVGATDRHASFQCMTGRLSTQQPPGGWPSMGAVISKLQGPVDAAAPPHVNLSPKMIHSPWADPGQPGYLGLAHAPFQPNGAGQADLVLGGIDIDRLHDRQRLLAKFDGFRRLVDAQGMVEGLDAFNQQAFGILTSSRLAEALDLEREDPKLRDRYGRGSMEPAGYGDAGPLSNDYFLTARRLVEAGARCVTLAYGRWDWHGRPHGTTFEHAREHLPMLDRGLATLLDDLRDRGLDRDVTVLVWGEFGRTPKINAEVGRDHWPQVGCALLAGGGMRTGQVIGATDRLAAQVTERPVHFQDVFATVYHTLGINVEQATIRDLAGRPQYLVDNEYRPLRELV